MKKILTLILVLLLAALFIRHDSYAIFQPPPENISDAITWTRKTDSGRYYMQSNRVLIDFETAEFQMSTWLGDWENFVVEEANGLVSKIEVFNTTFAMTPVKTELITYEEPGSTEVLLGSINLAVLNGRYLQITLVVNPDASASLISNIQHWMNNYNQIEYDFNLMTYKPAIVLDQPIQDTGTNRLWHRNIGSHSYVYMRYLQREYDSGVFINYLVETNNQNHFILNTLDPTDQYNLFPVWENELINNPDTSYFNFFKIVVRTGGSDVTVYNGSVNILSVNLGGYLDPEQSHILPIEDNYIPKIILKDYGTGMTLAEINTNQQVQMYWYKVETQQTTISNLPLTTGNPINNPNGKWGSVSIDSINTSTFETQMTINYNDVGYQINITPSAIDFLDNVQFVSYYTYDGQRFLYFSYDQHDVLKKSNVADLVGIDWKGHTIWNLSTNQLSIMKKLTVLTHIEVNTQNEAFAYFYTPTEIIDELISVTVNYSYRYKKITTGYTSWEHETVILQQDATTASFTTWETAVFASGAAASSIAGMLMLAGFTPVWPVALIGTAATLAFYSLYAEDYITPLFRYEHINQIERPTLSPSFVSKLEQNYGVSINTSINTPHRLFLGQFNKAFMLDVEFDKDTYKYTEIVYRRDTDVYIVGENSIITEEPTFTYPESRPQLDEVIGGLFGGLGEIAFLAITALFGLAAFLTIINNKKWIGKVIFIVILYVFLLVVLNLI